MTIKKVSDSELITEDGGMRTFKAVTLDKRGRVARCKHIHHTASAAQRCAGLWSIVEASDRPYSTLDDYDVTEAQWQKVNFENQCKQVAAYLKRIK